MGIHSRLIQGLQSWIATDKQRRQDLQDENYFEEGLVDGRVQTQQDILEVVERRIAKNKDLLRKCQENDE